jgi:hypothetical protein
MDRVYMTRMGAAFIEELTELRKMAQAPALRLAGTPPPIPADALAKAPGAITKGRQFMGEGFGHLGNAVGGQGPVAQRLGAPAGTGLWQHTKNVFQGGQIPTIENVAGKAGEAAKTVTRGGGILGGLKAVAKSPLGKAGIAGGALIGAGALAHRLLSRPKPQPGYQQY